MNASFEFFFETAGFAFHSDCRILRRPSIGGKMWKEKKPTQNFSVKPFYISDILELIGFCIMFICSGSTKIA